MRFVILSFTFHNKISVYPPSSIATARIVDRSENETLFFSNCEATITASRLPQVSRRVMLRSRFSRITANMSCDSFPEQLLRQVIAALFRPVPDLALPVNEPGAAGKHLIQPDAEAAVFGFNDGEVNAVFSRLMIFRAVIPRRISSGIRRPVS